MSAKKREEPKPRVFFQNQAGGNPTCIYADTKSKDAIAVRQSPIFVFRTPYRRAQEALASKMEMSYAHH